MVPKRGVSFYMFAFLCYSKHSQTVVLPNGKVVKTRRRARKSSTGFDTTKLFIGAEGTLGIVTEGMLSFREYLAKS